MPEDSRSDDVEKVLAELKAVEDRKQKLIDDLLKQREAVLREFDAKLAKLGYHAHNSAGRKRNHHKKPAAAPVSATPTAEALKPKDKPKGNA